MFDLFILALAWIIQFYFIFTTYDVTSATTIALELMSLAGATSLYFGAIFLSVRG